MSAHCMHGYRIWAADRSSVSVRPMIWEHRMMRLRLFRRAMSMTEVQYLSADLFISSEALRNSTCTYRGLQTAVHLMNPTLSCKGQQTFSPMSSMPKAFQTSTKYSPTVWIFLRSPPILLLSWANQSATLQPFNVILQPSAALCIS